MTRLLTDLSDALATAVAEGGASVVRVEARERLHASGIIWSADGTIVTSHHVIEQEEDIRVGLPDGQVVPAALVGRDPATDLAVLRATLTGLAPRPWAEPESLRVGHLVLALGRPGQSVRATLGVISAIGEKWVTPAGGHIDRYVQTDIVMPPGFSGGPLVAPDGRVIGLNTSALVRGLSIGVPLPTVRNVVAALLAHGKMPRGYLGVATRPARLPDSLAGQLGQETGLLIMSVSPHSPAEQAGLFLGDVIVTLGGKPVRFVDDLLTILSDATVGVSMPMRVIRVGQVREIGVTIGDKQ